MGGLWVDYNLMSTVPGLLRPRRSNFSDHGANRLGASALMQGLADGYFVIPYTIGDYLARARATPVTTDARSVDPGRQGRPRPDQKLHRHRTARAPPIPSTKKLGKIMWDKCGMGRNAGPREGPEEIPELREEFWNNVKVTGSGERAEHGAREGRPRGRLPRVGRADVPRRPRPRGVLRRHFREEYQTPRARRSATTRNYTHVSAWESQARRGADPSHREPLDFENVPLTTRSYK
jgi:succinate dehydrogenase / fumarate reductase flavoprotein subunit